MGNHCISKQLGHIIIVPLFQANQMSYQFLFLILWLTYKCGSASQTSPTYMPIQGASKYTKRTNRTETTDKTKNINSVYTSNKQSKNSLTTNSQTDKQTENHPAIIIHVVSHQAIYEKQKHTNISQS